MADITLNTVWTGNLTGLQVETFIKDKLRELTEKNAEALEAMRGLEERSKPSVLVSELDSLGSGDSFGVAATEPSKVYNVVDGVGISLGKLIMLSDDSLHCVTQILFSHFSDDQDFLPGSGSHRSIPSILYRSWSRNGDHGIPKGQWSAWKNIVTEYAVPLVEGSIEQSMGHEEKKSISQNAITRIIDGICDYLDLTITEDDESGVVDLSGEIPLEKTKCGELVTQLIGYDTDKVISQRVVTNLFRAFGDYLGLTVVQNEDGSFQVAGTIPNTKVQATILPSGSSPVTVNPGVVQSTGNGETAVMSQSSTTSLIKKICTKANIAYTENPTTGEITIDD